MFAQSEPKQHDTEANVPVGMNFQGAERGTHQEPFNTVLLDVLFKDPNGESLRIPAFWAGGSTWKAQVFTRRRSLGRIRFAANARIRAIADCRESPARCGRVSPYTGKNPLYLHGPLRVGQVQVGGLWYMPMGRRFSGSAIHGGRASAVGCIGRIPGAHRRPQAKGFRSCKSFSRVLPG